MDFMNIGTPIKRNVLVKCDRTGKVSTMFTSLGKDAIKHHFNYTFIKNL